jgi:DNA polymerase-4
MPMNKAIKLCPHLLVIHPDYHFYVSMSHQFRNYIRSITPDIEMASVDELYADFTDVVKKEKDVIKYFKMIQNTLYDTTGLKCSIGVAPTKFLAKMGSDYQKPMGLTIIRRRDIKKILYPLPIEDMFGVGKKTAPRLKEMGIKTIGDLANSLNNNDEKVLNTLGKFSEELKDWINGKGSDKIITEYDDPKSIGNSTTLKEDTDRYDEIRPVIEMLAMEVSERAKKENRIGNTIQIMVKDTNYKAHNISFTFSNHTNNAKDIFKYAIKLYEENFLDMLIRAVGVTLQNLIDIKDMKVQMTFFDYEMHEEESKTKLLINDLNRKIKGKPLKRASEVKKNGHR